MPPKKVPLPENTPRKTTLWKILPRKMAPQENYPRKIGTQQGALPPTVRPTVLSELVPMNYASSERVANVLEENFFTRSDLVFAAKSSKECTPNHF